MARRLAAYLRALAVVTAVRGALWMRPLAGILITCARTRTVEPRTPAADDQAIARVVVAVHRVSRIVPRATCLTQALAAQWLLGRAGITSCLRFGVARQAADIAAHAWLEVDGRVVIGDTPTPYTPLTRRRTRDDH